MYPHRIRLRGPWEGEDPAPRRVTLPCQWCDLGLIDFPATVRLRRRFGMPRQLDAFERIWLICEGLGHPARVHLNAQFRDEVVATAELEVTRILLPRNELVAEFEVAAIEGPIGEFALEIRCQAYLRDLQATIVDGPDGSLMTVDGQLAGCHNQPLDLYLLVNNATVGYLSLRTGPTDIPFRLSSSALEREKLRAAAVRVELVNGGVVWHAWDAPSSTTS